MQGASPLASPRPSRKRHGLNLRCRCPMGSLPGRSPGRRVLAVPKGWFARLVACQPCLWLYFFPPSPCPRSQSALPGGKGRIKVIFMQGASPLASPRAEPMVRRITERKRFPASGAARVQPLGTCMARLVSAASGLMPGCRGRSPRRNKLWISPFPGGEERSASAGGGIGAIRQTKGRVSRRQRRHPHPLGTASANPPHRGQRGTPRQKLPPTL